MILLHIDLVNNIIYYAAQLVFCVSLLKSKRNELIALVEANKKFVPSFGRETSRETEKIYLFISLFNFRSYIGLSVMYT
jgi:hypothetical protein